MPLFKQIIAMGLVTIGSLTVRRAVAQQHETLADVLKQEAIPFPPIAIPHLNSQITGYATSNDEREFLIAYYLANPQNELRFPLFLTRFDKRSAEWKPVELSDMK